MTTNTIRRTIRVSVLSLLLALVVCSFLISAGADARSISPARLSQANSSTSGVSNCPSNTTNLLGVKLGEHTGAFSCNFMTVKVGVPILIVNNSIFSFFVVHIGANGFTLIHTHTTLTVPTVQAGTLDTFIYNDTEFPRARLSVTIVS